MKTQRELRKPVAPFQDASEGKTTHVPIIVHSHLRWDFVWQRPQQLLSRFAVDHPILFVEEPMENAAEPELDISLTREGVVRVVPLLPNVGSLSTDARCALVLPLLESALRSHPLLRGRFQSTVQWFYSPMTAQCFHGKLGSVGTIYDCMDELSNFRFAPPDIGERENFLLSKADVVFTGGYELYRSKSARHPNTHFFGCGVDAVHFGRARAADTVIPAELAKLPRPILGYYGVIDERLDYELIAHMAQELPDASIVMVGPVVKVSHEDLPQAANIHWLGPRSYEDLPALVKGFDICLMPFAMNAATQYINPTKTLEYLAAGKPVVSTAVPDVVRQFSDFVEVAQSGEDFVAIAARVLAGANPGKIAGGIERAQSATWEATVRAMRGHIMKALERKLVVEPVFVRLAESPGARFVGAQGDD